MMLEIIATKGLVTVISKFVKDEVSKVIHM